MKRPLIFAVSVVAAGSLLVSACSDDEDDSASTDTTEMVESTEMDGTEATDDTMAAEEQTIVDIAAGTEDFSTLVSAVQAAGLAETLGDEGPYTVFAPTNEAFEKLPEGTLESLLDPANKDTLTSILTYHVVEGTVMAADVQAGEVPTVNGATFEVATDGGVTITDGQGNTATVTDTDIVASNGVIHVIDTVLLPPEG